jgi:hypothetical protein
MKKIILFFLCIATANFAMSERQNERINDFSSRPQNRGCRCLVCAKQNDNEDTYVKDTCGGGWQKKSEFPCTRSQKTNIC